MDRFDDRAICVYGALAQRCLKAIEHRVDCDAADRDKEPNRPYPASHPAVAIEVCAPGAPHYDDDKWGVEGG